MTKSRIVPFGRVRLDSPRLVICDDETAMHSATWLPSADLYDMGGIVREQHDELDERIPYAGIVQLDAPGYWDVDVSYNDAGQVVEVCLSLSPGVRREVVELLAATSNLADAIEGACPLHADGQPFDVDDIELFLDATRAEIEEAGASALARQVANYLETHSGGEA